MLEVADTLSVDHLVAIHHGASITSLNSPDHGPRHWKQVALIAHALWAEGVAADPVVLLLFAAAHDSQRQNEYSDPDHGRRAAEAIARMRRSGELKISDDQDVALMRALWHHDSGGTSEDPTVAACWDADRLTLTRVGQTPRVQYMSSETVIDSFGDWQAFGAFIVNGPVPTWDEIFNAYANENPLLVMPDYKPEFHEKMGHAANGRRSYVHLHRIFAGGELCDELKSCLWESGNTGTWIQHPLVHTPYFDLQAEHYNRMLRAKKEACERYLAEHKYGSYVFMFERPYRVQTFMNIGSDLAAWDETEWWSVLRAIWTDTENMWQNCSDWRELLENAPETDNPMAMEDDERKVFDELPSVVTVYRGTCAPDGLGCGLSWTLDRKRAEWFAQRLWLEDKHDTPRLLIGKVQKSDVIAYLNSRQEDEIVALSENVEIEKVITMEIPT